MMNARALWKLGYPDQAEQRAIEAYALGMQLDHPFSSAVARWSIIDVKLLRGEIKEAAEKASEFDAFVKEQGFPFVVVQRN
jgi:hypothetical protein